MEFHKLPEELTLFHDVHRAHHNAMLAALAAQGLQDLGQPRVLFVLDGLKDGGATQRELAESVHVSPATMTASLKSLSPYSLSCFSFPELCRIYRILMHTSERFVFS